MRLQGGSLAHSGELLPLLIPSQTTPSQFTIALFTQSLFFSLFTKPVYVFTQLVKFILPGLATFFFTWPVSHYFFTQTCNFFSGNEVLMGDGGCVRRGKCCWYYKQGELSLSPALSLLSSMLSLLSLPSLLQNSDGITNIVTFHDQRHQHCHHCPSHHLYEIVMKLQTR